MNVDVEFTLNSTDGTSTSFFTEGVLETKKGIKRLKFIEETDAGLDTVVDIYTNRVVLTRTGKLYMKMEFNPLQETLVHLKTDKKFEIKMLNKTFDLLLDDNKFNAIYQTEMDKDRGVHHQLLIKYRPKKKSNGMVANIV